MKKFIDGNKMCFTLDSFVNLQESPAIFVSIKDENVKSIIKEHSLYAASGAFLVDILEKLHAAQQSFAPDAPREPRLRGEVWFNDEDLPTGV